MFSIYLNHMHCKKHTMASLIHGLVCTNGSIWTTPTLHTSQHLNLTFPSSVNTTRASRRSCIIGKASAKGFLDTIADLMFEFVDEPLLPSQSNFAPVDELQEPVIVATIQGKIPDDFTEGVYIRNGANPLGGSKSVVSVFGKASSLWVEGEGMLHAIYFKKHGVGDWTVTYNRRYVETETYLLSKKQNRRFFPAAEGDSPAVFISFLLNSLRFGAANHQYSNTNIFEHGGKFYSIAENHGPQQIDINTLQTLANWTVNGAWTKPFTSHPKKAPGTGELVMFGINTKRPFYELGVISADGSKFIHKADLEFDRVTFSHEIGVTQRYNVILDFPLTIDLGRLMRGGSLLKYEEEKFARIGILPRYGRVDSVKWFYIEPGYMFHLINCFEDGDDEVVVIGFKAPEAIIPGPDLGKNKFEWFSRGLKHANLDEDEVKTDQDGKLLYRVYEWRLNMKTGEVAKEGYLTGTEFAADFPTINPTFTGLKNKYAYAQVLDSPASVAAGLPKYNGVVKLYFEDRNVKFSEGDGDGVEVIKVEHHMFPANTFCTGVAFVAKSEGVEEDDGWIIAFVHNEDTDTSEVHIVDAKRISGDVVAVIALPYRVPYGFHAIFAPQIN